MYLRISRINCNITPQNNQQKCKKAKNKAHKNILQIKVKITATMTILITSYNELQLWQEYSLAIGCILRIVL